MQNNSNRPLRGRSGAYPWQRENKSPNTGNKIQYLFDELRRYGLDRRGKTAIVMKALANDPSDAMIYNYLRDALEKEKEICRLNPDPMRATAGWKPTDLDGELPLGIIRQSGQPYHITLNMLREHVVAWGRTGGGKTTLIRHLLDQIKTLAPGIRLLIIERKLEFTDLARKHHINIVESSGLRMNPLRPPKGISLEIWWGIFTQLMINHLDIRVASSNFIQDIAKDLFSKHSITSSNVCTMPSVPNLADLLDFMKQKKYSAYSNTARYQETTVNRLQGLVETLPDMFTCTHRTLDISELINEDLLILIHDIPQMSFQNFLIGLIAAQVFLYKIILLGQTARLTNLFIMDEASSLFRRSDEIHDIPNYVAQMVSQSRAYGIGMVAASQYASDMSHSFIANTGVKFLAGGFERMADFKEYTHLRKSTREIENEMKGHRRPGDIFVADSRWPYHLQIQIPLPDLPDPMTKREVQDASQRYMKSKGWDQPGSTAPQTKTDDLKMNVLKSIYENPFMLIKIRSAALNVPQSSVMKAFEQLIAERHIIQYPVHVRAGRPRDLFEITPEGCESLRVSPPDSLPGKGSYLHKFYQQKIAGFYKTQGYTTEIEGQCGKKLADVLVRKQPDGEVVAIEIELHVLQNNHFIDNIRDDLTSGIPERVIVLVPKKEDLKHVNAKLASHSELQAKLGVITCDYVRNHMEVG